jgi:channel protein (hemolysin III family)
LTHLLAAGAGLAAAVPLLRLSRQKPGRMLAVLIYAFGVVATLAISGTYHSLTRGGPARAVMQHVDHAAIWLLIAGTFTAVHGLMCRGFWRHGVLLFIWAYAAVGVLLQTFWFEAFSGTTGLALYLGMGWLGIASAILVGRQIGFRAVRPIWYAGMSFTGGAILEATGHPILVNGWVGPHEIFHVSVIVGLAIHWWFIRGLLIAHAPGSVRAQTSVSALLPEPALAIAIPAIAVAPPR